MILNNLIAMQTLLVPMAIRRSMQSNSKYLPNTCSCSASLSRIAFLLVMVSIYVLPRFYRAKKQMLIIYDQGQYRGRGGYSTPRSYKEVVKLIRWKNSGDLVWAYGASRILDLSNSRVCKEAEQECLELANDYPGHSVIYRPTANLLVESGTFRARRDVMSHTSDMIRRHNLPFLFIGIGTQGQFRRDPDDRDMDHEGFIMLSPKDYRLSEEGIKLIQLLQSNSHPILMRGAFTRNVSMRYGVNVGIESGCPSLLINQNPRMGALLERKYIELRPKVLSRTARIAINIKPQLPRLLSLYISIFQYFPNSLFFVQESNDARVLEANEIPFQRIRAHASYERWKEDLCSMDLSIGSRIHGNMAALGCSDPVPVFVIAPDHRVLELSETMQVPFATIYDERLYAGLSPILEMLSEISFDGHKFDRNRCEKARVYKQVFYRYGLPLASYVEEIAAPCIQ